MRILDRYLAKEFIRYFCYAIVIFTFLFILVEVLQRTMKYGATLAMLKYALLQVPFVVSQMVPVACLMASMFALTNLAKNSELVAMYACGISLERISVVLLLLAAVIGILNFFISDSIVPNTLKQSQIVYQREVRKDVNYRFFKAQGIWYRAKNAIYNIHFFDPKSKSINGLDVYLFDNKFRLLEHIQSQKALYNDKNEWILQHGLSTTYIDDFPISHRFHSKVADYIKTKPEDLKEIGNLETMSFGELKTYIQKNKKAGFDTLRHEVNLHAKIAYAIACIVMAFLGIPFSTKSARSGTLARSFGIGLMIAFFFWICLNISISFGYSGALSPMVSAWIANIMFTGFGIYLLRQQQRMKKVWPF